MIPIVKATREFDHTKDITFIKCHEITYTELLLCMQSKFTVKYYLYLYKQRLENFVVLFENFKFPFPNVEYRNFFSLHFSFPEISFYFNVYVGGL